jgi:hypothetical protein
MIAIIVNRRHGPMIGLMMLSLASVFCGYVWAFFETFDGTILHG